MGEGLDDAPRPTTLPAMLNAPRAWRDPSLAWTAAAMLAAAAFPFVLFIALAWDIYQSGFGRQTWAVTVAPAVILSTVLVRRWGDQLVPLNLKLAVVTFAGVCAVIGGTFPLSTTVLGMHRGAGSAVFQPEWWSILFGQAIWMFAALGGAVGAGAGAIFALIATRPRHAT